MRRHLALALVPLVLLGTATQAAAANRAGPDRTEEPGITIHRVAQVVPYRLVSQGPDGQLDSGTVRLTYTCTPGGDWPTEVHLLVTLTAVGMSFGGGRFGVPVPCDGERHKVSVEVSRGEGPPFTPPAKHVAGEVTVVTVTCATCSDPVVAEHSAPVRVRFAGAWPEPTAA
jgi:hypothetical protein